jgi:hypothetical protein
LSSAVKVSFGYPPKQEDHFPETKEFIKTITFVCMLSEKFSTSPADSFLPTISLAIKAVLDAVH